MVKQSWDSQMIDGVFPTGPMKELKDRFNVLILKDKFELDGIKINTMKLKPMVDGSIHIWVKNGKTGRHAAFRLKADIQKELVAWLQCNIK